MTDVIHRIGHVSEEPEGGGGGGGGVRSRRKGGRGWGER